VKKSRITLPDGSGEIEVDDEDEPIQEDQTANAEARHKEAEIALRQSRLPGPGQPGAASYRRPNEPRMRV